MRTTSVAFLAVGKFTISRGLRYPAALSPREPLHQQTLPPLGIDANSRFFTDCYHERAAAPALCEITSPRGASYRASRNVPPPSHAKLFARLCGPRPLGAFRGRSTGAKRGSRRERRQPLPQRASSIGLSAQEGWNVELILLAMHIGLPAKRVERLMSGALGIF